MESCRHPSFIKAFDNLPKEVQALARDTFQKWKESPGSVGWHRLKQCKAEVFSAEMGLFYRAVGVVTKNDQGLDRCTWLWIGSHETYNNWIKVQQQRVASTWTKDASVQRMFAKMDANPAVKVPEAVVEVPRFPSRRKNR